MRGRVTKILSASYFVTAESKVYECKGRKKLKKDGDIYVGDFVEIEEAHKGSWTIERVYPRRNRLIRPYVANVDLAIIVVAPFPEPDLVLLDKIICNCLMNGIKPLVCYNKADVIGGNLADVLRSDYSGFETVKVSAHTGEGIEELRGKIQGSVVCMAGQSAVGKTSIMNALTGGNAETGGLSKIMRGRNTTRHIECFDIGNDTLLMDTCGFSLFELDLKEEDLKLCYDEFADVGKCRFTSCRHISEPDCAVKIAVSEGKISRGRYERYKIIYEELKRRKKLYE